jgi:hypothetical protein
MEAHRPEIAFATPRKLPKPDSLNGRVVVLDVAFASDASGGGFAKLTGPFIEKLGKRLVAWVDHHDHVLHEEYKRDPRFVLATKAEHGACPEMITPELVARTGRVDTIVCHTDFDGLCSAAKWIRAGAEPYPGSDDDARAIDTRLGTPSATAQRFDRAIRARGRDTALLGLIVRHLAGGLADAIEKATRAISRRYRIIDLEKRDGVPEAVRTIAFVDATAEHSHYDKTLLLLLGQERAGAAVILDLDTLSLAAPFNSGLSFLALLGLSGGMPTFVSIPKDRLRDALTRIGVRTADLDLLGA